PKADFIEGEDSFKYKANDGKEDSNIATVKISINHPPKAEDLSATTVVNRPVEIQLKATDQDVADILTYFKVSDPTKGTLSNLHSDTGKITYTPKADFIE